MKKFLSTFILISVLTLCSLASNAVGSDTQRGFISINSNADTEVSPDVADISFTIKTYDNKSMQKAINSNKEISQNVYSLLKSLINSPNGDYLKTSNYSASPVYTYSNNKKSLDKYEVSNKISVHTKSLDKLGTMIDKAIAAGATNVDSLNFSVSNYETQCNKLIESAAIKAKNRATSTAKALNSSIDGIKNIDVSCSANNFNTPRMYVTKNTLSASYGEDSIDSTTILSGVIKLQANVNASFFLK